MLCLEPVTAAAWRTVRVFISSTFRDMHAEREELVKRVFPQLRKLCEERGVGWAEVDLRWGVTEEQAQRGEVLPICLAEIDRWRPFFIGLLGERYGWVLPVHRRGGLQVRLGPESQWQEPGLVAQPPRTAAGHGGVGGECSIN